MTPTEKDAMALADRPKGHGLMCVIFATDLYAAMAKDGYTLPTNGSFGPAASEFIRAHITDYMKATRAEAELAAVRAYRDAVMNGVEVYEALDKRATVRTSTENVSDVLDAVARVARAATDAARGGE